MTDTDIAISCEADLEAAVGARPAGWNLKAISFLDAHCEAMLGLLALARPGHGRRRRRAADDRTSVPPTVRAPSSRPGASASRRSPSPAWRTARPPGSSRSSPATARRLRINGTLRLGDEPGVDVHEAFLHCAKAIIRSKLWDEPIVDRRRRPTR